MKTKMSANGSRQICVQSIYGVGDGLGPSEGAGIGVEAGIGVGDGVGVERIGS